MGRRKFCDKLGKEHKFEFVFPAIGGWYKYGPDKGHGRYRCEKRCKICKFEAPLPVEYIGNWVYDPDNATLNRYRKSLSTD